MSVTTVDPLVAADQARLAELEGVIDRSLARFIEVGRALKEINDNRLYLAQYATFEDYCEQRWNFSRGTGYAYINTSVVADNIRVQAPEQPISYSQAMQLVRLRPEQQQAIVREVDLTHTPYRQLQSIVAEKFPPTFNGAKKAKEPKDATRITFVVADDTADALPLEHLHVLAWTPWNSTMVSDLHDVIPLAEKVLLDGQSLLVHVSPADLDRAFWEVPAETGMHYHWCVTCVPVSLATTNVEEKRIATRASHILWFTKGAYQGEWLREDIVPSLAALVGRLTRGYDAVGELGARDASIARACRKNLVAYTGIVSSEAERDRLRAELGES